MTNFCQNCGEKYENCPKCEAQKGKIFMWRQYFCSIDCFKNYEKYGGNKMRIQYEGKTYTIKEYNIEKGSYETTNNLKVKEEDIQAFVLTLDEYKELKSFKETVKKTYKKEEKEDVVE